MRWLLLFAAVWFWFRPEATIYAFCGYRVDDQVHLSALMSPQEFSKWKADGFLSSAAGMALIKERINDWPYLTPYTYLASVLLLGYFLLSLFKRSQVIDGGMAAAFSAYLFFYLYELKSLWSVFLYHWPIVCDVLIHVGVLAIFVYLLQQKNRKDPWGIRDDFEKYRKAKGI